MVPSGSIKNRFFGSQREQGKRYRLTAIGLIPVFLFVLFVALYIIPSFQDGIMEEKEQMTQEMVTVALKVLENYHNKEKADELQQDEAQRQAAKAIEGMTFGEEDLDYFWINDLHPTMIMHPFRPDLEGQDLGHFQDPDGVHLFEEFVRIAREKGSGFLQYQWQYYDDPERFEPKLSYVAHFEPWDWVIGTGVYIDDIADTLAVTRNSLLLSTLLIAGITVSVFFWKENSLRRTEKDLKESEQRLNTMIQQTPAVIYSYYLVDGLPQVQYINENVTHILGFQPQELLRDYEIFEDLIHPEDQHKVSGARGKLMEEGRVRLEEYRIKDREGQYRWLQDEQKLISHEDGTLEVIGAWWDITDRKQIEEYLKKSEERYRTIFDFSPVGIMIADGEGNILAVNQAMCEISELSQEELEGNNILETLVLPEHLELAKRNIAQILNGEDLKFVIETNNEIGNVRYKQLHETRIVLPDGGYGILSMQTDFTDRKAAEEALQKSEEKHRRLFETMEQGVIYQNVNGNIISANPAAERILGLSFEEMQGKNSQDSHWQMIDEEGTAVPGTDHPALIALRTGQRVGPVTRGVYHPGKNSHVWLSIISIPLFQPGKKGPFQVYSTFSDITEQKEAEERIRYISFHDSLTGLYNRYYLEEEMKRLDTERQLPIGIVMIDLNGLKLINDTYGHEKGDAMLKKLADILKESCRQEELIARWGGDEFVILLPGTDTEEVKRVCQRIARNCQDAFVEDIPLSIAIGTAQKDTMDKTLNKVLNDAEDAMYKSKLSESRSARSSVLNALLKVLAEKSFETETHSLNMKRVALQIGEGLNLPKTELNRLSLLTTLHDIGKVNISEEILTKNGPLNEKEWEIIKKHPEIGYRIARATEEFSHVAEDILSHHEHWDGSGYPRGIKGNDIPLLARIVSIADAYEVMSSGRPYKKAMSQEEIILEFKRFSGRQFDPELVEIFLSVLSSVDSKV